MSSLKLAIYRSITRLLFLSAFVISAGSEFTRISFPDFSANGTMRAFGDSQHYVDHNSILINAKSVSMATGTCGMLMYEKNVRIRDTKAGTVASFSTSFTFTFTSPSPNLVRDSNGSDTKSGTRMAFVFADRSLTLIKFLESLDNLTGPCNVAAAIPREYAIPYFGVAFDTELNLQWSEPSNNFIGIIDGSGYQIRKSGYTYNLCGNETHCSYLSNGGRFTAWIDLSPERTFEVRLANGSHPTVEKPLSPLIQIFKFELPREMGDNISLIFAGSSSTYNKQAHEVLSWSFSSNDILDISPSYQKLHGSTIRKVIAPVVGVGGTVATLLVLGFLIFRLARHRHAAERFTSGPRQFSYKELRSATKNFSDNERLGSGGSGAVYRGSFEGSDRLVAVKRIHYESKCAEATFLAEISSLGQIRHQNVVRLQGWCHEKGRLLLVYEYLPNGSLNEWLHDCDSNRDSKALSWKLRHYILEGVATALEYLHMGCLQCILHRDIKSSNVMLDANFKAHLGDFGLGRLMDHHQLDKTTMAAGTLGYMAPEMPYTGKATKESDVYSFGILVLEVVCGRRPLDLSAADPEDLVLLYRVWRAHESGTLLSVADPRLLQTYQPSRLEPLHDKSISTTQTQPGTANSCSQNNSDRLNLAMDDNVEAEKMVVKNLLHLGLLCCLPNPKARPTMRHVIQMLKQIGEIDNVDYVIINESKQPLPDTKPLGLYPSLEFSLPADSTSHQFLSVKFPRVQIPSPPSMSLDNHFMTSKVD